MSKRSRSSLVSTPSTGWSVTHWASTPRGMQCPQLKKTAGTFRPLERGMERPVAHAFEGMEQSQGDHLTGPEVRLGVFGHVVQLLIDFIEQRGDKLHGHHTALLSGEGYHTDQRGGVVGRLQAQKYVLVVFTDLHSLSSLSETNTIGYYLGLPLYRLEGYQAMVGVPVPDAT